jgi:four helix bundle protein
MRQTQDRIENFGGYQKAMQLWDLFWEDSEILMRDLRGREIARQMTKSIGSISANMEEGYGRGFGRELAQFYRYSRGSARESRGWYLRARFLLPDEIVTPRVALLDEIIGILVSTLERRGNNRR